ncbi:MAG: FecR domain-containing protein [Gemmataceae bacterium]|nr:FecR domain-containing protein [Gemmataceae bacterium]MDW8263725.1 FecR domain-containing protein [Gemmataceae bacterium]
MRPLGQLIDLYLDDLASEADCLELGRRLRDDPAAAELFARMTRAEAMLGELLREQAVPLLQPGTDIGLAPGRQLPRRGGVRQRSLLAAGLLLLLLSSLALWLPIGLAGGSEVVAGQVLVNGAARRWIPQGARVEVADGDAAIIRLPGGSRLELAPRSQLVWHGSGGADRPRLSLVRGGGCFSVGPQSPPLLIDTPIGSVAAHDSDVAVELWSPPEHEGGPTMNPQTTLAIAVAVLLGQVEVQHQGQRYLLGFGQSHVFAADDDKPAKKSLRFGTVAEVAADGKSFVLERQPAKPGTEPTRWPIRLTDQTRVVYRGVAKGAERPTVGSRAAVRLVDGSEDEAAAVEFGSPEPDFAGRITAMADDGKELTLETFRKDQPPETRTVRLTDATRIRLFDDPKAEARPAVGDGARIWLAAGSKDAAIDVELVRKGRVGSKDPAFKNKGKPDNSGKKPAEGDKKPHDSPKKPAHAPDKKPADGAQKPAPTPEKKPDGDKKPTVKEKKPAEGVKQPGNKKSTEAAVKKPASGDKKASDGPVPKK